MEKLRSALIPKTDREALRPLIAYLGESKLVLGGTEHVEVVGTGGMGASGFQNHLDSLRRATDPSQTSLAISMVTGVPL